MYDFRGLVDTNFRWIMIFEVTKIRGIQDFPTNTGRELKERKIIC